VFSDGHGLAAFTDWYDDLNELSNVDWSLVSARYWADQPDDNDRQRRKQAEFLVWQSLAWELIETIAVLKKDVQNKVERILTQFSHIHRPKVVIMPEWYYY
jgi:hypothetical protein